MSENYFKILEFKKMLEIGPESLKMSENGPKSVKMPENGPKKWVTKFLDASIQRWLQLEVKSDLLNQ